MKIKRRGEGRGKGRRGQEKGRRGRGEEGKGERGRDKRRIFPSSQLEENRQRLDTRDFLTNQHTFIRRRVERHHTRPWILACSENGPFRAALETVGERWLASTRVSRARRRKRLHLVRVESAV